MPSIRHVVVLMLENRSYDHMLGFLGTGDGLNGTEFNLVDPANAASERVTVSNDAQYVGDFGEPAIDPSHEHSDVNRQLFNVHPVPSPLPATTNNGFVKNYAGLPGNTVAGGKRIMKCFDPAKLPALSTLAREFASCVRWFSSVPGQTWPNRFFVHAASSGGFLDNKFRNYPMRTIFENLSAAGEDWAVYFHDTPQCLTLAGLRKPEFKGNFKLYNIHFPLACRSGTLPSYSFIEPRYFDFLRFKANDQHPPHDVSLGEHLIADVYETLRNSPAWPNTLLVVTYDEHGGLYDHVLPPSCADVDGVDCVDPPFDFKRLGVRVPAIIVSPFVAKGTVDETVYDHTSVPATVKEIFDLPNFLTARDAAANTFTRLLGNTMRSDTPTKLPRPPGPRDAQIEAGSTGMEEEGVLESLDDASSAPLSEFQQSLIDLSKRLELGETPRERVTRAAQIPRTEHDGAVAVRAAVERYLKSAVVAAPRVPRRARRPVGDGPVGASLSHLRVCVDRVATPPPGRTRMALVKDSTWVPGQTLTVRFLDGDRALQERVRLCAEEWMQHANIRFSFGEDLNAPIRISFARHGSWSHLGRDCLNVPATEPTMNFGWLKGSSTDEEVRGVVLHEFGHALGCVHEHNHPDGGINWNKDVVYAFYAGPPNFWTKEQVDANLFAVYQKDLTVHSALDPHSVMMYPIEARFTTDGFSVGFNSVLSPTDIAFIKKLYPFA